MTLQDTPTIDFDTALALHRKGDTESAQAAYRALLDLEPEHADALNNLALLRKHAGDPLEAEALYRRSLDIRPEHPEVCSNLGVLLMELGQLTESETWLRKAIALRPGYAEAWNNLGNALQGQRRYDEARLAYQEILQHWPKRLHEVQNAAREAHAQGQPEEAQRLSALALNLRATLVESCWNLSLLLLLLGQYAEAWPLHEARYDAARNRPVAIPPGLPCPQWKGESLDGKAILVWFEQGMGDEIQFVRYIPWLKSLGARQVTLVCKAPLLDLLNTVEGVDQVIAGEGQFVLPPQDFWVLPLSLPLHHKTTLENIPNTLPYLAAKPDRVARWEERIPSAEHGLRVGLAWAGSPTHRNDAHRSMSSLKVLEPLGKVKGVRWISLQKGEREHEALPARLALTRLGPDFNDFGDTAAVISQLDLVITVDTAVAHVAGALGKPCWVLLPWLGVDWRWLLDREDSPWYPKALRLFRQPNVGDWAGVIQQVVQALTPMAEPHVKNKPVTRRIRR